MVAFGHSPIVAHLASIHLLLSSLPINTDLYLLLMPPATRPVLLRALKVRVRPPFLSDFSSKQRNISCAHNLSPENYAAGRMRGTADVVAFGRPRVRVLCQHLSSLGIVLKVSTRLQDEWAHLLDSFFASRLPQGSLKGRHVESAPLG